MSVYPWFKQIWQQWCQTLAHDLVSPATLLVVKEGMGESDFIEATARSLLCVHGSELCGYCHHCQLMDSQSHPDFHWVKPEKEGKAITVDQVRQINQLAQESSQFGGYRVIVIQPAHVMNESAANALLKTLEEPPARCCFMLVTDCVDRVLPTILSRCRQLHVPEPDHRIVAEWLAVETGQEIAPYIIKLNDYAPVRVLDFIQSQGNEAYLRLEQLFCHFLREPLSHIHDLANLIQEAPSERLTWLWYLLTDAQKAQFQTKDEIVLPGSEEVAQCLSYSMLYQQYRELIVLLNRLEMHRGLNAELLVFDWLLKFQGAPCLSTPTAI
ncbi:DNA polymerase III subunit delta' [Vibrio mangrovi]|uniref:DNA polymerase III subunit delta' n=1 Tax=Vibrio mangrovi TaxID=474394 RepID=A0A1Y6IX91_9VIBR|nr:DNA polymerase III subunit delta' [Vibrio mangrovi]MDW6001325.1 DNA polymerase III subunit delta' [Vibrio mangrovi]SMS00653.1 DNA polymerase III subunit delta' [Vibrio mangrovi]